jgi:hypothetical protein
MNNENYVAARVEILPNKLEAQNMNESMQAYSDTFFIQCKLQEKNE